METKKLFIIETLKSFLLNKIFVAVFGLLFLFLVGSLSYVFLPNFSRYNAVSGKSRKCRKVFPLKYD